MRAFLVLLLGVCLAACTVGPDFQRPVVLAPSVWGPERTDVPSRTVAADVDSEWWRSFNDPKLTSLITRLVAQNLDLQSAAERVVQGRAERQIVASQGLPTLDEQSQYTRTRQSPNGFLSLVQPAPGAPLQYDLWQNGIGTSWELDLFGKVRRAVEAQDANTLASVEDRRGIALSLLAELAQDYLQLRGVQAQLDIAERNEQVAARNTALVVNQYGNGVATTLDMAQARSQQATIAASIPPLRTQQAVLINAIGLLLAEQPRALEAELKPHAAVPGVPLQVPVGLPSELVRRRPDVREAEARLHAATAATGVAVASFYPDVVLNGMADLNGLAFANAFSLPSGSFQVGPTLSIPLFEGGKLTGQLRLRKSEQRVAAIDFKKTVLHAWQEVDDALTAFAEAQQQRTQTAVAARQNAAALQAARQRYEQGAGDFLNVTASESQLLQSENALATSDTEIATDLVALYRALGGGWQVADTGAVQRSGG